MANLLTAADKAGH
jgi:hypothetical protein